MRYLYVLVRQDLPPSQQAVQACHAAHEAGNQFPWQGDTPHLVLVGVPDEPSLQTWLALSGTAYNCTPFREPDLSNALTAVAFSGVTGDRRKLFANLPLVKFHQKETVHV